MNDIEKRARAVQAAMNHKVGGITPARYLHLNEAQWGEVVDAIIAALSAAQQSEGYDRLQEEYERLKYEYRGLELKITNKDEHIGYLKSKIEAMSAYPHVPKGWVLAPAYMIAEKIEPQA